jgi:thiamine-monophosphate kinase
MLGVVRTLRDIGEFDLIARIAARADKFSGPDVVLGIGDDAAILRSKPGEEHAISTDSLVEGRHFRWQNQSASHIGRRALLVNLSDLAAMGARPVAFTVALAAPPTLPVSKFDGLLRGLLLEARANDCPLVGGNLSGARETSIAVTVIGAISRGRALRRDTARPGDRIFVTGTLGGAGLALARSERFGQRLRHLPTARLAAGRALARMKGRGACIDISDGLISDLRHLLERSGCSAEIDLARVPRPRGFAAACAKLRLDPDRLCSSAGEDYELLFTLGCIGRSRAPTASLLSRRLGVAVTEIGNITLVAGSKGLPTVEESSGWRHF